MVAWETPRSAPVTISLSAPVRRVRRALHRPGVRAAELRGGLESGDVGGEGRCAALHRPAALHAGQARVLQVPAGRAGPSHPRPTPGPPPVPPRAVLKTPERATPRFPSEASGMAVPSPLSRLWRACASALPARRTQRLFRGHCFGDRRPHAPGTEVPSRSRQGPARRPASPSLCRPAPQRSFGGLVRPHVMHEFMNALEILARTWRLVIVANEEWPSGRSGGRASRFCLLPVESKPD